MSAPFTWCDSPKVLADAFYCGPLLPPFCEMCGTLKLRLETGLLSQSLQASETLHNYRLTVGPAFGCVLTYT